jgi:hypothetical protein
MDQWEQKQTPKVDYPRESTNFLSMVVQLMSDLKIAE